MTALKLSDNRCDSAESGPLVFDSGSYSHSTAHFIAAGALAQLR